MKAKGRVRFTFLLLAFCLAGCGLVGTEEFNTDSSKNSPFAFEYPASWEIVYYKDSEVYVLEHAEDMEIDDNGELQGFDGETNAVIIYTHTPEEMIAEYGAVQTTPLTALQQMTAAAEEEWTIATTADEEMIAENEALFSLMNSPGYLLEQIIEQPVITQIQGREVALLKSNVHLAWLGSIDPYPFYQRWLAAFEENNQTIFILGVQGSASEEEFKPVFDQVVGSLQLLDSER
jgi:hypothetical protein